MPTQVETTQAQKSIKAGKFNGALASFALGAYNYLLAFGVNRGTAHKIALDYASDVGRGMSENLEIASKVGKAKKDGESVVSFSGKTHAIRQTPAMSLVRVCLLMDKPKEESFFAKRLPLGEMPLRENLSEYLDSAIAWADGQTWED